MSSSGDRAVRWRRYLAVAKPDGGSGECGLLDDAHSVVLATLLYVPIGEYR